MSARRTVDTCRRLVVALGVMVVACRERVEPDPRLPAARAADAAELAAGAVPRMLNAEPPFRYPAELWAQKVQGDVTLRLHVDSAGRVHPESTSVATTSGYPALDSAAVRGSAALTFAPAVRDGRPVGQSIRFPVHFRHPDTLPQR